MLATRSTHTNFADTRFSRRSLMANLHSAGSLFQGRPAPTSGQRQTRLIYRPGNLYLRPKQRSYKRIPPSRQSDSRRALWNAAACRRIQTERATAHVQARVASPSAAEALSIGELVDGFRVVGRQKFLGEHKAKMICCPRWTNRTNESSTWPPPCSFAGAWQRSKGVRGPRAKLHTANP